MARPPKLAKPTVPGMRYLYTPVYIRRSDEDAFAHCVIHLEQCGHKFLAEHDHAQLRFRLPVHDDGTCPQCGSAIGGQYNWQFYTEGSFDPGSVRGVPDAAQARVKAAQASQPKNPQA
jgi:hypothetical protein